MIDPERIDAHKTRRHFTAFLVGLIACLSILAIQIWRYWFICDDAFISFRYARNLATGHGLVFNPGFERVEGYTNFLWVLMLAGAAAYRQYRDEATYAAPTNEYAIADSAIQTEFSQ